MVWWHFPLGKIIEWSYCYYSKFKYLKPLWTQANRINRERNFFMRQFKPICIRTEIYNTWSLPWRQGLRGGVLVEQAKSDWNILTPYKYTTRRTAPQRATDPWGVQFKSKSPRQKWDFKKPISASLAAHHSKLSAWYFLPRKSYMWP